MHDPKQYGFWMFPAEMFPRSGQVNPLSFCVVFFQEPVKESPYHNGCCGLCASSPVFFSCNWADVGVFRGFQRAIDPFLK